LEARALLRINKDATITFLRMRADGLNALAGRRGVAADVGFISYFSQGNICDLSGLVNGRGLAAASNEVRARSCAAQSPEFAFLDSTQRESLQPYLDLRSWVKIDEFPHSNAFAVREVHELLVRTEIAADVLQRNVGD